MTTTSTATDREHGKMNGDQIWQKRLGGDVKIGKHMLAYPDQLTLVRDKAHPLWDPRVDMPVSEEMVISIMLHGVQEPIRVVADGDKALVGKGRGRTQAAVEANRRLVKAGKDPLRVPVMPMAAADPGTQLERIILENEIRRESTPMQRAQLLQRLLDTPVMAEPKTGQKLAVGRKRTLTECRPSFGKSESTLRNWLDLLKLSPKFQAAVEAGKVSARAAWEMVQSGVVDHAAQDKALPGMIAAGGKGEAARSVARGDSDEGEGDGEGEGSDGAAPKPEKPKAKVARSAKIWDRFLGLLAEVTITGKVDQRALTIALAKWGRGDNGALREFPEVRAAAAAALTPPKPKTKGKPAAK